MFKLAPTLALFAAVSYSVRADFWDFKCNDPDASTPTPLQSMCTFAGSDGQCVQEPRTGDYYCGWKGATCDDVSGTLYSDNAGACDFGSCVSGQCHGGFGDACTPNDDMLGCLGWLLCSPSGVCGGEGGACGDVDGCAAGLECEFASPNDALGACRRLAGSEPETDTSPLPTTTLGASAGARKRSLARKQRLDYWN